MVLGRYLGLLCRLRHPGWVQLRVATGVGKHASEREARIRLRWCSTWGMAVAHVNAEECVEYSVAPMGNDAVAYTNRTCALDYFCPQDGPFGIVRCWAHQHIGAKCVTMYDQATGDVICESCPTYGNETGVVGNEAGYVVAMSATMHDPPYMLQPGQQVTLSAAYDASQPYGGVMSLLALQLSNFTASGNSTCQISYDSFVQVRKSSEEGLESSSSVVI